MKVPRAAAENYIWLPDCLTVAGQVGDTAQHAQTASRKCEP